MSQNTFVHPGLSAGCHFLIVTLLKENDKVTRKSSMVSFGFNGLQVFWERWFFFFFSYSPSGLCIVMYVNVCWKKRRRSWSGNEINPLYSHVDRRISSCVQWIGSWARRFTAGQLMQWKSITQLKVDIRSTYDFLNSWPKTKVKTVSGS